jgi:hypothetical protein
MAYILLNIPYYYLFWGECSIAFLLRLPLVNKVLDAFQSRVVAFGIGNGIDEDGFLAHDIFGIEIMTRNAAAFHIQRSCDNETILEHLSAGWMNLFFYGVGKLLERQPFIVDGSVAFQFHLALRIPIDAGWIDHVVEVAGDGVIFVIVKASGTFE